MKKFLILPVLCCIFICFSHCDKLLKIHDDSGNEIEYPLESFIGQGEYDGEYWPSETWRSCKPEEVGINSEKLIDVLEYVSKTGLNTKGFIIIKSGYIIAEAYFNGNMQSTSHEGYALAQSITSALIGIAIDKELIGGADEKIYQYFPEWQTPETPELKKQITIKHLLTMTPGFDWNETINDEFYLPYSRDYIQYVLQKQVTHEPGTFWAYSNGAAMLLSGIIEAAAETIAFDFAVENLFEPVGIKSVAWELDPAGHTVTAWGIWATVRDYARFGYLYLKEGMWDGVQVISQSWIEESTQAASDSIDFYGYLWRLQPGFQDYENSTVPESAYGATGAYLQRIFIVPEKDLVVVRVGYDPSPPQNAWNSLEILTMIINAYIK